jgi:hypothetical protein
MAGDAEGVVLVANKKRCLACKKYFNAEDGLSLPIGFFCSFSHATEYAKKKQDKLRAKEKKKVDDVTKEERKQSKERLKELRTRSKWYDMLQTLVNQFVRWRDRNEPCCTCGTTNPNIKYDAGHFHTKKARPDIRFELKNIHKQCSQNCNVYGSGMRNEYEKFIAKKYGQEQVDKLARVGPSLKEQFPNWQDIELEIKRYRKLLRSVGIKPNI